ncbi:MAG: cysteine desulfurase family protein [Candidatus Doudnabacteria bacterium]|nr:cysteine desulfurase family protein [Candidatus Doudnabacteria bacterium]
MAFKPKKITYLDYAATTPIDPLVKKVMLPFFDVKFGNPSSLHCKGREARQAMEDGRKKIANLIGARPEEIIFTAGGTESVNLAIFGLARQYQPKQCHLIASKIEHQAVLNSFETLKKEGFSVTLINVDKNGSVEFNEFKKAVRPETKLVSIMHANNEIGAIEPIAEIGKWLKGENVKRKTLRLSPVIFHTDACQSAGFLDLNVNRLGVDLMTINGSKIYGPKQAGILFVKNGVRLRSLIRGGGQEQGLRSGTENVPGIAGLVKALELVHANRKKESKRLSGLRDYVIEKINKKIKNVFLNGSLGNRLPNNINITIKDVEGEALLLYLDACGICVSTGSACESQNVNMSHVLLAIGLTPHRAKESIRVTLGKYTTKNDLDYFIKKLSECVVMIRKIKR